MFGREPIQHRDNLGLREVRNRHRFDERARVRFKAAAVQIDQHPVSLVGRNLQRRNNVHRNTRDSGRRGLNRVLSAVDFKRGLGVHLRMFCSSVRILLLGRLWNQRPLRFRADRLRHRNDARDIDSSLRIDMRERLRRRCTRGMLTH